jgi:hypothetical protein
MRLTLVSHDLCPYVRRAAIVLLEKETSFESRWFDLPAKSDWFVRWVPPRESLQGTLPRGCDARRMSASATGSHQQ